MANLVQYERHPAGSVTLPQMAGREQNDTRTSAVWPAQRSSEGRLLSRAGLKGVGAERETGQFRQQRSSSARRRHQFAYNDDADAGGSAPLHVRAQLLSNWRKERAQSGGDGQLVASQWQQRP